MFSPLIKQLIAALQRLPSVGPKSAQRIALQLLKRNRKDAILLAKALEAAAQKVGYCSRCRTFSETALCDLCANPRRNPAQLCIVETPADIIAIEQTHAFRGYYFVLMGRLSPLDGIGPKELGIDILLKLIKDTGVKEIILATSPTVEGEVTARYIAEQLKTTTIAMTQMAKGLPTGAEFDYLDGQTIEHAFKARVSLRDNDYSVTLLN